MPATPFNPVAAAWLVALIALALLFIQLRQDRRQYRRFKSLQGTSERQAVYRSWLLQAWFHYTLLGAGGLLLLRRPEVLWAAPGDFLQSLEHDLLRIGVEPAAFASIGSGIAGGLVAGTLIACVLPLLFGRRAVPTPIGDIAALLPRNAAEKRLCAALAINAGIGEEIFFRALLPLAGWQITGEAALALLLATGLFAAVHAYQGLAGVAATFVLGLLFAGVYVCTRQLWLAMLLHALLDARTLLVTPWALQLKR